MELVHECQYPGRRGRPGTPATARLDPACLAGATDVTVSKQASWGATRDNIIHDLFHDRPHPADPIARQWTV